MVGRGSMVASAACAGAGRGRQPDRKPCAIIGWWAIGVGSVFWIIPVPLTLIPVVEVQTVAVLMSWAGFLPVLTLTVLAIVFGAVGLSRARAVGGLGRRDARFGLWSGIGTLAAPVVMAVFVMIAVGVTFAISG